MAQLVIIYQFPARKDVLLSVISNRLGAMEQAAAGWSDFILQ